MSSGVVNGQLANETTFNDAFMARNGDTDTVGKVDLLNTDTASGASIANIQRAINSLCSSLGITNAQAHDFLISWASSIIGSSPSTAVARINALTAAFRGGAGLGHNHDGTDGQGEKISAEDLLDFNQYFLAWQKTGVIAINGASTTVTLEFTGKSPGGGSSSAGVLTTAPLNRVELINNDDRTYVEDNEGRKIYARLTEASGIWTLTFFKVVAGIETGHTFSSPVNVEALYREVFTQDTRPTISENPLEFGTVDVTADVVDATSSLRGVVSTGTQDFGGFKTFVDGLRTQGQFRGDVESNNTTTGTSATLPTPAKLIHRVTNGSLVSISDITSPSGGPLIFVLRNETGNTIALIDGANISTGTGADLDVDDGAAVIIARDSVASQWFVVGGSGGGGKVSVFGSEASPRNITTTGITSSGSHMSTSDVDQLIFVSATSGEVDVSASPQITGHTKIGSKMTIVGTSDEGFIKLEDGNGLSLNGDWFSFGRRVLNLVWTGTVWLETGRNS